MRLAYVCGDMGVPVFGSKGCSLHVQELLRAMLRRGVEVELFAARAGGLCLGGLEPIRAHILPLAAGEAGDPAGRERRARAAHAELLAMLARARPFDLVYERYSLWSCAGVCHAAQHNVPGVLEVNAPLIDEQSRHRTLVDRAAAEAVAAEAFASARVLIGVSSGVARYLNGFAAARGKVHVVPNGVDPARFAGGVPASRPADAGVLTLGFVGSMKPWHGLEVLLRAVAAMSPERLGRVRLLAVGEGGERASLEAEAGRLGLTQRIEFTGAVPPADVPALLASMDIAVAPYPSIEDFYFSPLKVYEYMAAGLPVIASAIGDIPSVIESGVNGVLVQPGDAEALRLAIEQLADDAEARCRLGKAARHKVGRRHTWDAVAGRVLELAGLADGVAETA